MTDTLRTELDRVLPSVRADLESLVSIPSVSSDPLAAVEVRRSADLTARLCGAAGFEQVNVIAVEGGQPAVLASIPAPAGQPTVLLYAHHDVQPAGDPVSWSRPPFVATERGGRLYGRGTADDKAGIAAHLAAVRAYGGHPPVGVTLLVEGEEEIGSPTLSRFLDRYREELAADIIVLADADNFAVGQPAFTTTLRGLGNCVIEMRASMYAVHSGTYGGAAPDALTAICRLLATLHQSDGKVAVRALSASGSPDLDYPEDRFRSETGLLAGVQLIADGTLAARMWAKPAITVLAVDSPSVDTAANVMTPYARAKISLRISPGDSVRQAAAALTEHLRSHAPWGVEVTVTTAETAEPHSIDARGPRFDAARRAYTAAYGRAVVAGGAGGAIPFVAAFAEAFPSATILVTSAGADPDCRAHGIDENLHLDDFTKSCHAEALLLNELSYLHSPRTAIGCEAGQK